MIYYGKFKVTSPFGLRYLNGQMDNHKGIDVVGIDDKHIRSVCGGTVAVSAMVDRAYDQTLTWQWGNYVRIDGDDGYKYYYCHMSEGNVTVGKRVEAGDIIGIEGNTGYSFGSHCHFEVRDINGVSVCPASFLGIPNEEGEYESVVITIGDGNGKNFWCVLFPPLCMLDEDSNIEYSSLVKEIIDKYF